MRTGNTASGASTGQHFIAFDDNVDANEWVDPAVLDRLIPGALRLTLAQDERRNQDLPIT